jgi:hypothetical protein
VNAKKGTYFSFILQGKGVALNRGVDTKGSYFSLKIINA